MKVEYVVAGLLFTFGVVSAVRSISQPPVEGPRGDRILIAVHDAAKAMFWLSLAGFFLAYGLADGAPEVRWLALLPILMAVVRLLAVSRLSRS